MRSPIGLHLPDADRLTAQELGAVLELKPSAMLCLVYAQWDNDKGVAEQVGFLARALGHDRLYVRFHADPHPPGYAKKIGGPEAWGRLCAQRMTQYYQSLADTGVQLHAILANETDADYEGGLSVAQASDFYRRALQEYAAKRPQDVIHVPAPTGAPQTHREHLQQYKRDGWVRPDYVIDGHGYDGDLENVINVLQEVFPGHEYVITETNDLSDFGWPIELLRQGRVQDIVYFTLNWARGGEGRVQPPTFDDAAKQMSLMRFPARYAQFKNTITASIPEPIEEPQEPAMPTPRTREEVIAISNQVADEAGMPRTLLLAAGIAESGLRWDARRPTDPSQDAAYWTDVSHGVWQQTVRWSEEYRNWYTNDAPGHNPNTFPGADVTEAAGVYYYDVEHAARVAAKQLAPKYNPSEADGIWRALNRYNWPAGGGNPKTPENGANYRRAIAEAEAILGTAPVPVPVPPSGETVYEPYTDPEPAGTFAVVPLGVIFHGSRSGRAGNPLEAEYKGTANYEVNNTAGLGWNATAGPGKVAIHMDAHHWGWNARAASDKYIGVEITQPTVDDPLPDSVPVALADYIFDHVWPVWGELWHFPSHAEIEGWGETGQKDGKTDLYPMSDERMNDFRQKVYDRLNARKGAAAPEPEPVPEPTPEPTPSRALTLISEIRARLEELEKIAS